MKTARRFDLIGVAVAMLLGIAACAAPANAPNVAMTPPAPVASAPAPRDVAGAITAPAAVPTAAAKPGVVDLQCKTAADCAIKDVGSCCGARPQCVNVNSATFPDQVKAACAASDRAGICGFPSIAGCQCIRGQCAASDGPAAPTRMD